MNRDTISNWLRNEAEKIDKDKEKLELKIKKIMKSEDMTH